MTAFGYTVGLLAVLILVQLLAKPIGMALRVVGNSIVGGIAIWVANLAGSHVGFHIGLNPVSAFITGILGFPGFIGLGVIRWILR